MSDLLCILVFMHIVYVSVFNHELL